MTAQNETMISRFPRMAPRGSVLLFAIVLLAMLAMLGTTFILFVRQSRTVSSNTEATTEAALAAEAGMNQALAVTRMMVRNKAIITRKLNQFIDATSGELVTEYHSGVYRPDDAVPPYTYSYPYIYLDTDYYNFENSVAGSKAPPVDIAFWHFEYNAPGASGPVLSSFNGAETERFTTSPLTTRESSNGEIAFWNSLQGNTNDLYKYLPPSNYPVKQLPRVSSVRGEYANWIRDLDARLYAISTSWGIDNSNVPELRTEQDIRSAIYNYFYTDSDGNEHSLSPSLAGDLLGLSPGVSTSDSRFPHFRTYQDLSRDLPAIQSAVGDSNPNAYGLLRDQLDMYFSVYLDTPAAGSVVKDGPAAININTASVEVIAAAISQIPAETDGELLNSSVDGGRAYRIARRIDAKRPFLCRMDFEDFLAAHISGTSSDYSIAMPQELPADTDPLWTTESDPIWSDPPVVFMIYFGIGKRWGPGGRRNFDGTATTPELNLSQYLEMNVSTPDRSAQFKKPIAGIGDAYPNYPAYQKERFRYFFGDQTERAALTDELLTPKEFNNFINSVTSGGGAADNDDVQVNPPDPNKTLNPTDFVVTPGPDGVLGSYPSGDDAIMFHIVPTPTTLAAADTLNDEILNGMIYPGPDLVIDSDYDTTTGDVEVIDGIAAGEYGIAESFVRYNRPSYYSFFDDATYSGADAATYGFWDKMEKTVDLSVNPTTEQITFDGVQRLKADVETEAIQHMKFYYRLKPAPPAPAGSPRPDATLFDLISWRCSPLHSELTQGRAGFYQMAFNDWTTSWGPMQASGEPPFDPAVPETDYSTANMYSGAKYLGDVSWSPQFAFRSRYFGIYVLGRGQILGRITPESNPPADLTPLERSKLKVTGERRMEAVYDALKNEIIWQRTPVSEKHSLADPLGAN